MVDGAANYIQLYLLVASTASLDMGTYRRTCSWASPPPSNNSMSYYSKGPLKLMWRSYLSIMRFYHLLNRSIDRVLKNS